MCARAFLHLDDKLRETFAAAQDDDTLRSIRVEVVNGENLTAVGSSRKGDIKTDFDSLGEQVAEATPCLFLVALDGEELKMVTGRGVGAGGQTRLWLLVAWIPDDSKVREKMIYSSSKQDVRQGLGLGFFEGEYYANVRSDLTFDSLVASRRSGTDEQLLSEAELLKRDLNKQERASDAGLTSAAMGVLPFKVKEDLKEQLKAFASGEGGIDWVDMRMEGEDIALVGAKAITEADNLQDLIYLEEPRFILLRWKGSKFLVYSCPEESPVRLKMTYSSSKASVVAAATREGLTVDHMVEIRAVSEIDEAVAHALRAGGEQSAGGGTGAVAGARGGERISSPVAAVSRPSRPGRGRARLTKRS